MRTPGNPIRLLIVDDSPLARDLLRCMLSTDPEIHVVGEASNGREALLKIAELKPDIVTMDIEMPVMGGIEAIESIMALHPVPILVVTSLGDAATAYAAISRGALEVVEKPDIGQANATDLVKKVRLISSVRVAKRSFRAISPQNASGKVPGIQQKKGSGKIVAIVASTGGPQAIHAILSQLPHDFKAPIVVTQHIAAGFALGMAEWLNVITPLTVDVAKNGEILSVGRVYINPSDFSMRVTKQSQITFSENENHDIYHPSCNALLCSIADAYGERGIGVILSGMGDDGVKGISAIKAAGGTTLAQDEKSSLIYGMNRLAVEQGDVDRVVSLSEIPGELVRLTGGKN